MGEISILIAFGAGIISFVSPCVLPLYPAFLSYITGMSIDEVNNDKKTINRNSLLHTIFFLLGFSLVFILIGFSATYIGEFLSINKSIFRQVGAILIIFFGLMIVGVLNIKFFMKDRRLHLKNRPAGLFGSFLIGLAFSMGWTPCTGPSLTIVIAIAMQDPERAIIPMVSYALGFAVPFLLLSIFIGRLKWLRENSQKIVQIGGYLMIVFGVALYFNWMEKITLYLAEKTGFFGF